MGRKSSVPLSMCESSSQPFYRYALDFQRVTTGSCCHVTFTYKYLFLYRLSGRRQDVVTFGVCAALEQ